MIASARREHEAQLARRIDHAVEPGLMIQWRGAITAPHGSGSSLQTWLWAPPAKHSSRQIEEMVERIECLYALRVHERMGDFPDDLLRRHARRLAGRPPSAGALIQEPARRIETACFLRYCLLTAIDRLLMMSGGQIAYTAAGQPCSARARAPDRWRASRPLAPERACAVALAGDR